MLNKTKLILLMLPIFCFSKTFDENFSLVIDSCEQNFSETHQVKILFSGNCKNDLKEASEKEIGVLLLFFPENCGLNLFTNNQSYFENINEVRNYVATIGFKITHFQIVSEIAHFKDFNDMNNFYLKYFNEKASNELVENRFANHQQDYFFPIKFCLAKLEKK